MKLAIPTDLMIWKFWNPIFLVVVWACWVAFVSIGGLAAESGGAALGHTEVETNWPGVRFQIFRIERIPPNRLVVAVRIVATDKAPPEGTFLGTKGQIPPNASREDINMGLYDPQPFSLSSSVMIAEQTGQRYSVLSPVAPPGRKYLPDAVLALLRPGQSELLTIQFALPPEANSEKQTASFLLPNAKGPIARVPIPPLESVEESAAQQR